MEEKKWEELSKKIGPLRYQMSEADCVPITIINALLVVRKKRLNPQLLRLIFNVSIDDQEGTGFVSSQALAHILQTWFERAHEDGYENGILGFKSEIVEGESVHLAQNNPVSRCLNQGGVVCLTTMDGGHYSLLIAQENGEYLGFDPWWRASYASKKHRDEFAKYQGIINVRWNREKLSQELKKKDNKWIHLIYPVNRQN